MTQRQKEKTPFPKSQTGSFFGKDDLLFFHPAPMENCSSQKPHVQSQTESPQAYDNIDMMPFGSFWDP